MRVLWVAPFPDPRVGGHPAPWISSMLLALKETGEVELEVVTTSRGGNNKVDFNGIPVTYLKSPYSWLDFATLYQLRISSLYRWIKNKESEFDVIHVHGTEHQYEQRLWSLSTPVLVSIQGLLCECYPFYTRWKRKLFLRLSTGYELKGIRRLKNFSGRTKWDKHQLFIRNSEIRYFYGPELLRSQFYTESVTKGSELSFIGGDNELKRLDFAISVVNLLHKKGNMIHFNVIGKCSEESIKRLRESPQFNSLDWNLVKFWGHLDASKLIELYKCSLCLLHPSMIDNSPNSVCEAQIMGLPVIATSVGGLPSLIENGNTGFLLPHDETSFVLHVERLQTEPDTWKMISQQSRAAALSRHNIDNAVEKQLQNYRTLIEQYS